MGWALELGGRDLRRTGSRALRVCGLLLGLILAACSPADRNVRSAGETRATALQAGYGIPPRPISVQADAKGLVLTGRAAPFARVRLATPAGEALFSPTNGTGAWQIHLPASDQARLFGLSSVLNSQSVQAQGYLLITPDGRGVMLRAGAGAQPLAGSRAGIQAIDFDREGGAMVSGVAGPGEGLTLRVDGRQAVEGRAGSDGRFAIALSQPVSPGPHEVRIFGNRADWSVGFDARPALALADGPFRVTGVARGLRVDWMTPGGGVQTTLLFD